MQAVHNFHLEICTNCELSTAQFATFFVNTTLQAALANTKGRTRY